jgi:ankyrin repeat protein
MLLRRGAVRAARDVNGWSPLFHAAAAGADECIAELLADPGMAPRIAATDRWGRTALCWACVRGHVRTVRLLLAHGASADGGRRPQRARLERSNSEWKPPLHLALGLEAEQMVELMRILLEARANPNLRGVVVGGIEGGTAIQVAQARGACTAVRILLEFGARPAADTPPSEPSVAFTSGKDTEGGKDSKGGKDTEGFRPPPKTQLGRPHPLSRAVDSQGWMWPPASHRPQPLWAWPPSQFL